MANNIVDKIKQAIEGTKNKIQSTNEALAAKESFDKKYQNQNEQMSDSQKDGIRTTIVATENGQLVRTVQSEQIYDIDHEAFALHKIATHEAIDVNRVTYEGYCSVNINGKPQLVFVTLTNEQRTNVTAAENGYPTPDKFKLSGFIISNDGKKVKLVDTSEFVLGNNENYKNATHPDILPAYQCFDSVRTTFNTAAAEHARHAEEDLNM